MRRTGLLGILVFTSLAWGCASVEPADLVLVGGKVVTLDESVPEAQGLAVRGDRIVALGSSSDIEAYVGPNTQRIELNGQLAIPGFIEGHGHFTGIGQAKLNLELMPTKSWEDIVQMVADAVAQAEPGQWIVGRGWHQEKWTHTPEPSVEGLPTHASLSAVSPDNPVYLTHASGHGAFVNAKALELAGIDRNTANPAGGEIVRGERGEAIGMLRETAQRLVGRARSQAAADRTPEEIEAERRKVIQLAAEESLSKGITSFQDAGSSFATVDLLKSMVDSGELPLRLWIMLREGNESLAERARDYRIIGYGDNRLTVRAIKRSIDGALGSHGAWLLEPYADLPTSAGLNTTSVESIVETARIAAENNFQLCVHAIGDRANRETLDIFEDAFKQHPHSSDFRWRIEHAQHVDPVDVPRFGQLGVIASIQGVHCTSDGPWVPDRLGQERTQATSYLWQQFMQSGALVTNGTDAPVEDVSPIASYYSTVSRRLPNGEVFMPEERMSREEALRSYTINNALAAFEEDIKGTLSVGKLADIVVLDRDILTVPEGEIPPTKILYTIVGGKVEYQGGA